MRPLWADFVIALLGALAVFLVFETAGSADFVLAGAAFAIAIVPLLIVRMRRTG